MLRGMILTLLLVLPSAGRADQITTFENVGLGANSFRNYAGAAGGFSVDGNFLNNNFDSTFDSWSGWAISNMKDITTSGFTNQYSSITGSGSGGSATYAVGFTFGYPSADPFHPAGSYIDLAAGMVPESLDVTNTTYAYLSMLNGDQFAHKFTQANQDFLLLEVIGFDKAGGQGNEVGDAPFYLANFQGANASIANNWNTLDLTLLAGAKSLVFRLSSNDNNPDFGMNTPAYFAMDNLRLGSRAVPEPGAIALLCVGLACVVGGHRKSLGRIAPAMFFVCVFGVNSVRADYDPQVGQAGSLGISKDSSSFVEWASSVVSIQRGPQDITNPSSPLASLGNPSNALGAIGNNTGRLVSLGDGGQITLGFDRPIANGAGADFAVFENGFLSGSGGLAFLELAFVDVSSDGVNFFRFPSVSLTQTTTQVGSFGLLDARNLNNLAGKYIGGYGTGFNLDDLSGISPALDINNITEVRITDVVGSIDPRYGSRDSLGNLINDPFKTAFASGGFDLNGVGVIHTRSVPEPSGWILSLSGAGIVGLVRRRALKHRR